MRKSVILHLFALVGAASADEQSPRRRKLAGCSSQEEWACDVWQVGETLRLSGGREGKVKAPVPLYTPDPKYSAEAVNAAVEGKLHFTVTLNPNGRLAEIKIDTQDSGSQRTRLNEYLDTLRQWRFQPALLYGQPVAVQLTIEFTFNNEQHPPDVSGSPRSASVVHAFSFDQTGTAATH
jgi:TonB family protein